MGKIVKYVMLDIIRNKIILAYTILLLLISLSLFTLEDNTAKGLVGLLNIIMIIVPLVSIVFSTIYIYNSREFIELLVAQPVKRTSLIVSLYGGLAFSLGLAFFVGAGIPVLLFERSSVGLSLTFTGLALTVIFVSLALFGSVNAKDKAKGIGVSILLWFYFAIIFDSILLFLLFQFQDYPLERISIFLTSLNPIDLCRILVMLKMDISAMMGYSGAVFKDFLDGIYGTIFILFAILAWTVVPLYFAVRSFNKKDL